MLSSVALLLLPTSAFAALASCPCLTSFPFGINPANGITIGGQQHTGYDATYGLNTCYRHDLGKQPSCASTTNRPAWCMNAWCYVDRYNCNLPTAISTYFPSGNLYYSYRTCGSANTFSNWFGSGAGTASTTTSNGGDGQTHTIDELVDVVHDWCNGAKFAELMTMVPEGMYEGSVIRTMHRLEELLRQLIDGAKVVGNTELEAKCAAARELIVRDVVFAASLYT